MGSIVRRELLMRYWIHHVTFYRNARLWGHSEARHCKDWHTGSIPCRWRGWKFTSHEKCARRFVSRTGGPPRLAGLLRLRLRMFRQRQRCLTEHVAPPGRRSDVGVAEP